MSSLGAILRLAIRVCPLDKELNLKALELLEDDRRRDSKTGHKKRLYRMSCMVTPTGGGEVGAAPKVDQPGSSTQNQKIVLGTFSLEVDAEFTDYAANLPRSLF